MDIRTTILDQEEAAQCFAALGSEQRLAVLQTLVAAGPEGLAAGVLAERVALGASTLTHHLRFLTQAGLVHQRRAGRSVLSSANYDRVQALSAYLLLNCCADAPVCAHPHEEHEHG
jgi:ArsR family transcriptional regulator, arsenate/arsenite/antimonite-responsive transcriptional repressor